MSSKRGKRSSHPESTNGGGDNVFVERALPGRRKADRLNRLNAPDEVRKAALNLLEDVALARQSEERLVADLRKNEEASARLAAIVEWSDDAIISKDLNSIIKTWNRGAERIFGYTAEEVIGKPITVLFPPDHIDEEAKILARLRRGESIEHYETVRQRKDGKLIDISLVVSPIRDRAGKVIGASKIARDITERKLAEAALQRSEARARNIFETAGVSLWEEDFSRVYAAIDKLKADGVVDLETYFRENPKVVQKLMGMIRVLDVNEASVKMFEATDKSELIGMLPKIFVPESMPVFVGELLALAAGQTYYEGEAQLKTVRGNTIYVTFTMVLPQDPSNPVLFSLFDITDRKRVEAILQQKDAELQLVADSTPVVLVRNGRDLKYKFINKAGAALFGLAPSEIVGRSILEVMGKKAFAAIQPYIRTVLRGEAVEFEAEIPYPAAGKRWMRVSYLPEYDRRRKVIGWLASIVDITEIRAAQQARREVEERFSRFMGNLPGLAWIKDLEGRYIYANDSAVKAFGTPREELYARNDDQIFLPDVAAAFKANDRKALDEGRAIETIEKLVQKDGLHYSLVTKFPIVGADGAIAAIGGMAIDITERVKAEEQLRRSQERFLLAQRAGGVGIWDWDIVAGRTYWSETTWAFYGEMPSNQNPDEAFWSEHLYDEDRERVLKRLQESLDSTSDRYWDEFRIQRPDGSILWIETSATITRDERGHPIRVYGVNLDISRRRQSEEELRRAHDELELRVAERTHELAKANALLLKQMEEQVRAEEQRIRLLKRIVTIQEDERGRIARDLHDQLGQRLTALRLKIAALKDLSRDNKVVEQRVARLQEISEGIDNEVSYLAWELRPGILDDNGLVAALEQHVKEWSRHSGIPGEFSSFGLRDHVISPDLETNLYRIAQEALTNAAKHSRANRANVLLERRNDELILIIEDDGVGFNAGSAEREEGSGRGFGLSSMRDRASVIGGMLEIESKPGHGTTIFVRVSVA